jgi:hypothetical protein
VAQLAGRGEAAIFDGDDHRLPPIKSGAYLARITVAQPRACRAAGDEAAIMEAGEAERAACSVSAHHGEMIGEGAFRLTPCIGLTRDVARATPL